MNGPSNKDPGVLVHVRASQTAFKFFLVAALGSNGALGLYNFFVPGCERSPEALQCKQDLADARRNANRYLDALARYEERRPGKPGIQPLEKWSSEPPYIVHPTLETLR